MASNADLFIEGQVSGISVMLNVILRKLIETDQIAAMQLEPVLQEVESIRARIEKKGTKPEAMEGFDAAVNLVAQGVNP